MRRRLPVSFALLALFWAGPALAQEGGDPHLRAAVDRISPDTPAITVTIANAPPAPPALTVTNTSTTILEIEGFDLEPFLRIGPGGVQGNKHSRAFYNSQDPTGSAGVPPEAKAGAIPAWVNLAKTPTWRWFERRAQWRNPVPGSVRETKTVATLGPWTVPARYGAQRISIEGHMFYKPTLGTILARLVRTPTGIQVALGQGPVPGLVVTNPSQKTLEVTGRDGVVFARVGPRGVDVNVNSPTWRDTKKLAQPAPGALVAFTHTQDQPVLSWLERRASYPSEDPPASVESGGKRVTLVRWSVPATLDGAAAPIDGVTEWIPAAGTETKSNTTRTAIFAILAGMVALFTGLLARRMKAKR